MLIFFELSTMGDPTKRTLSVDINAELIDRLVLVAQASHVSLDELIQTYLEREIKDVLIINANAT